MWIMLNLIKSNISNLKKMDDLWHVLTFDVTTTNGTLSMGPFPQFMLIITITTFNVHEFDL